MASASTPPDCDHSEYTAGYCEENIYWLTKRFLTLSGDDSAVFSVFISNPARTVALWNQRMGSCEDREIVWDYHVVLALREHPRAHSPLRDTWIYDFDTCLPLPCRWNEYVCQTFPLGAGTPSQYRSLFRVVPGKVYLDNFASNRSHMLHVSRTSPSSEEPRYLSKPPAYPVICGPKAMNKGVKHNLMTHFVSMVGDEGGFGTVMDLERFTSWCSQ